MSAKVLAWYETCTVGSMFTWMDRFVRYHECELRLIDNLNKFPQEPERLPIAYPTLAAALEDMGGLTWVFLDPNGPLILDEYNHPAGDDVVYVFGSNYTGFGQSVIGLGDRVRLRQEGEIFAEHAIPYVLYDRYLFLQGRRLS